MLFITQLDVIPGKGEDIEYFIKKVKASAEVKIHYFLKLFGKPDYIILYEATSEKEAMNFVFKFLSFATPKTSLCTSID